jgi:hypothetical protein
MRVWRTRADAGLGRAVASARAMGDLRTNHGYPRRGPDPAYGSRRLPPSYSRDVSTVVGCDRGIRYNLTPDPLSQPTPSSDQCPLPHRHRLCPRSSRTHTAHLLQPRRSPRLGLLATLLPRSRRGESRDVLCVYRREVSLLGVVVLILYAELTSQHDYHHERPASDGRCHQRSRPDGIPGEHCPSSIFCQTCLCIIPIDRARS